MRKDIFKKYSVLRGKFENKLNEPEIISDGEIINLYDLVEILNSELKEYNEVLLDGCVRYTKTLDKTIGFYNLFGAKLPYILKIVPEIRSDGTPIIRIKLDNYNETGVSEIILLEGSNPLFVNVDFSIFSKDRINKLINDCVSKFSLYFILLNRFKSKYNGISHVFDKERSDRLSIFHYDDGFIYEKVDLNNLEKAFAIFSISEDFEVSRLDIRQLGGEIFEYMEYYNKDIKKRCPVNINSLNELYQSIVKQHLDLNNQRTLNK